LKLFYIKQCFFVTVLTYLWQVLVFISFSAPIINLEYYFIFHSLYRFIFAPSDLIILFWQLEFLL